MSRIAYVNGRYVPHADAAVHVEDRGYQFADGVYEVCEIRGRTIVDLTGHLDRLERSLREIRIDMPVARSTLPLIIGEVLRRNRVRDGIVYLQVSRGVARRDHPFPTKPVQPALVVTARANDPSEAEVLAAKGIAVVTTPENRWERVDIKTVGLLPNVLAKQIAREAGAREAWFVDTAGMVTEGASTNAWIILPGGRLVTRQADTGILRGVTRTTLIDLLKKEGMTLEERPFSVGEAHQAIEAFVTSATSIVLPVVSINGRPIGNGAPGAISLGLRREFHAIAERVPF